MAKETIGGMKTEESGKRFRIDCSDAGKGCTLSLSGTYEEVLEEGLEHGKRKHGMSEDEAGKAVKSFIKEDVASQGAAKLSPEPRVSAQPARFPNLPS